MISQPTLIGQSGRVQAMVSDHRLVVRLDRAYEELTSETLALVAERDAKRIKIDWQFSIQSARNKLNRHYTDVNVANEKFKET